MGQRAWATSRAPWVRAVVAEGGGPWVRGDGPWVQVSGPFARGGRPLAVGLGRRALVEGPWEESRSGKEDRSLEDGNSWAGEDNELGKTCIGNKKSAGYQSKEETLANIRASKGEN